MTTRAPLVLIDGKIAELPTGDKIGGAPAGDDGAPGADGTAPLTTKGDLLTYDSAVVALPVGTDGHILTADSAQPKGIKWASPTATFTGGTLTSKLVLRTGGTAAGSEPLQFVSGSLLTSATAGTMEFLTDKFYGTITTGTARKEFALWDAAGTSGRVPFTTTGGRLTDSANIIYDSANNRVNFLGATSTSGNDFYVLKSTNAILGCYFQNASTGTAARSALHAYNSANSIGFYKYSTGYTTSGLEVANLGLLFNNSGNMLLANGAASPIIFAVNGVATTNEVMRIDGSANVVVSRAALATNATNGFLYIPTCAGAPTGAPTSYSGRVPIIFDTTNNNLYVYNSGWKKTTTFA